MQRITSQAFAPGLPGSQDVTFSLGALPPGQSISKLIVAVQASVLTAGLLAPEVFDDMLANLVFNYYGGKGSVQVSGRSLSLYANHRNYRRRNRAIAAGADNVFHFWEIPLIPSFYEAMGAKRAGRVLTDSIRGEQVQLRFDTSPLNGLLVGPPGPTGEVQLWADCAPIVKGSQDASAPVPIQIRQTSDLPGSDIAFPLADLIICADRTPIQTLTIDDIFPSPAPTEAFNLLMQYDHSQEYRYNETRVNNFDPTLDNLFYATAGVQTLVPSVKLWDRRDRKFSPNQINLRITRTPGLLPFVYEWANLK